MSPARSRRRSIGRRYRTPARRAAQAFAARGRLARAHASCIARPVRSNRNRGKDCSACCAWCRPLGSTPAVYAGPSHPMRP
ncbi:hypothetical protein [Lysobacter gummosus]|uniref:hypothetical protein n=1 Tax=Lysobacter gummosus TaxID=262324 RepID=UPI00363B7101